MLAPSIGNIHGRYVNPPNFDLDRLQRLQDSIGPKTETGAYIVMHGTDDLSDELFAECVKRGTRKMNMNSWTRDPQVDSWIRNLPHKGLPEVYDEGMEVSQETPQRERIREERRGGADDDLYTDTHMFNSTCSLPPGFHQCESRVSIRSHSTSLTPTLIDHSPSHTRQSNASLCSSAAQARLD